MTRRICRQELVLVIMAVLLGAVLRAAHTDRLDVEHFDEGIYASTLWYDAEFGQSYPMRHLYAPPLLPNFIAALGAIPGLKQVAPFLPAIVLGSLTAGVLWWMARSWFGMNAGLVIVFIAAMSDFHILFSRMALTDVPALFFICSSVAVASRGIQCCCVRTMVAAGILAGLAWWTKYTGWLALAILISGSGLWWMIAGRRTVTFFTLFKLLAVSATVAFVVWTPVLWWLQDSGGYKAVSDNHKGYYFGFHGWRSRLIDHMVYHFRFDSWLGAASLGMGTLAAATRRWIGLRLGSTEPEAAEHRSEIDDAGTVFPSGTVLRRFIVAALALAVMAGGIGSAGVLICVAIGGMAGMFLWPTLTDLYQRRIHSDRSPPCDGGAAYRIADFQAAPSIDPVLGACIVVAWFGGMLVTTPTYSPYPRLSLPLIASIWLAASGGLAWWMEATMNVARRGDSTDAVARPSFAKRLVTMLVMVAFVLTISGAGALQRPYIWQDRTSLRDASWHLADAVVKDVAGEFQPPETELLIDEHGIIHPDRDDEYDDRGERIPGPTLLEQLQQRVATRVDPSTPLADYEHPQAVVYGFGEPAVLKHLHNAGLRVAPVQDVTFSAATSNGQPLPTYLVLGPYALRTPGLLETWAQQQYRFDHIANFDFAPSEVVIYNLFSPTWVAQHDETAVQTLELYRLKQ
ncbi:MAG: glycosyltransferase family 39 protein [Planctomycetaceae bacterium]